MTITGSSGYYCKMEDCHHYGEWYMAAGSSECEAIIEGRLCATHMASIRDMPNSPHDMQDACGHHMEEVIFSHMIADMAPMVLVAEPLIPSRAADPGTGPPRFTTIPVPAQPVPAYPGNCQACGKLFSTLGEAFACMKEDLKKLAHACPACGRDYAHAGQAQACCRSWVSRYRKRDAAAFRKGMRW